MKIRDFKLECYFGLYEFTAPYLLTQSDCESMTTEELLAMEPGAKEGYLKQWLGYTETWGDPELRKIIAGLYEDMEDKMYLVFHGAQGSSVRIHECHAGSGRPHDSHVSKLPVSI